MPPLKIYLKQTLKIETVILIERSDWIGYFGSDRIGLTIEVSERALIDSQLVFQLRFFRLYIPVGTICQKWMYKLYSVVHEVNLAAKVKVV